MPLRLSFLVLFFGIFFLAKINAQETYADHKPIYRPWTQNYILDKIDYQKDVMIFHFRSVCQHDKYNRATFYPRGGEYAWFLKDKKTGKEYPMLTIKNLRKNGALEAAEVKQTMTVFADMKTGKPYTIFSCEIHFPRLPNDVTLVDFIEGHGGENKDNHYNCFDVNIKPPKDKKLGTEEDSKKNVEEFEERFSGKKTETPKPKPTPTAPKFSSDTPSGPGTALLKKEDLQCGQQFILTQVKFRDNSPKFASLIFARQSLDMIFEFMKENPKSELLLEGHSDIFGDKERNMELSKQRVLAVQEQLSSWGISPKRIHLRWYGGERPVEPEGSPKNRRVEARLSCD